MEQGIIKRLTDRGFGFIEQRTGSDLFFHSSGVLGVDFDDLRMGDRVEYDIQRGRNGRGDEAVQVRRLDVPS